MGSSNALHINAGIIRRRSNHSGRRAPDFSDVFRVAPAWQVIGRRFSTTATARGNTQLTLKVGQCGSACSNGRLDLTLGDGITDTNKHENNYHL